MSDSGTGNPVAPSDREQQAIDLRKPPASEYILPWWVRKTAFWAGVFTAYSQFVAVALLSYYRYHDAWSFGRYYKDDGYLGESFLVLWLFSPAGSIGRNEDYSILFTVLAALILAPLGSAGLFTAAFAKRRWRFARSRLLLGVGVGLAATVLVAGMHLFDRLRLSGFLDIDNPYEFFPMHGVLEFLGAVVMPAILYSALSLWLLVQAVRALGRFFR